MKTMTVHQQKSKTGYDFFYRSQLIFSPGQPGQQLYAVLEGEVALYNGHYRIYTLPAGHCLAEATLRQSGWVAVAHTNCRLVALDAATYAALANLSPDFVLGAIRPPRYSAGETLPVQIRWPSALLARRQQRPRRSRETAQLFAATWSSL